jgi:hypothetical protein
MIAHLVYIPDIDALHEDDNDGPNLVTTIPTSSALLRLKKQQN